MQKPGYVLVAVALAAALWKLFVLLSGSGTGNAPVDLALLGVFVVIAIGAGGASHGRRWGWTVVGGAVALGFAVAVMAMVARQRDAAIDEAFSLSTSPSRLSAAR